MKFRITLFNFLSLLSIILLAGLYACSSSDEDEPSESAEITSITPETGILNTAVTINGKGFGAAISDNIVKFNGVEATVVNASATQIVALVPSGASTGNVTVTVGSKVITGPVFTVYADEEPQATALFITFKANGVAKVFQDNSPGYQTCGDCSCSYIPALDDERYAGVDICQISSVTPSMIESLKNKTIPFKDDGFPIASFGYKENDVSYHTDYVDQETYSVSITDVVSDGTFLGKKAYKVTGTFECKVAKSDGTSVNTITDGTFVIRYTENF